MDTNADKLKKKAIREQQKRIKPGECQKYVRLVLDSSWTRSTLGHELISELTKMEIKYDIQSLGEQQSIIWERSVGQRLLTPEEIETGLADAYERENQVVRVMTKDEVQQAVRTDVMDALGHRLRSHFGGISATLLVLGGKQKNHKQNTLSSALIEFQILHGMNVLSIPSDVIEVCGWLKRFTKSIAEAPYKQQKAVALGNFKKYLANDKKQCVRVEAGSGFGRLWQQHLNRLPMVTLEVAETIIAQYSCPKRLLEEFEQNPNAIEDLGNLRIQRGGPQPLQSERRLGNVLSAKLHTLYNTRDPNALI